MNSKQKIDKIATSLFLVFSMVSGLFMPGKDIFADHITKVVEPPKIEGNSFIARQEKDGEYKEAVNTFSDGDVEFFLITQDAAKSGLTEISYKGRTYNLSGVAVGRELDKMKAKATDTFPIANANYSSKNRTFFIDDGEYIDTVYAGYTNFSHDNFSLVGLNKNANGEPAVNIKKAAYPNTDADFKGMIERYNIINENIYFENIIFDGDNKEMVPVARANGKSKNRGEYLFQITGGDATKNWEASKGFVMRDCILQNIGADSSTQPGGVFSNARRKNIAINFYRSKGQHNIEDIIIRNTKTKSEYGIISSNDAADNYLKNITIVDDDAYNNSTKSIAIENSGSAAIAKDKNEIFFSGKLNLPEDNNHNYIYVQDYLYKGVVVPKDFNYAKWNGIYSSALYIYKDYPKAEYNRAIQDLRDNYWVVDNDATFSISDQFKSIKTVMTYTNNNTLMEKTPKFNVKVVKNTDIAIKSFNIPTGLTEAYIVAVNNFNELYDNKAIIPFVENGEITGVEPIYKLYNFDFCEKAKYTLSQAIDGIVTLNNLEDQVEIDDNLKAKFLEYPIYEKYFTGAKEAKVKSATKDSFVNCKFTVLNKKLQGEISQEIVEGEVKSLNIEASEGYTKDMVDVSKTEIDDKELLYFSSDDNIVTVSNDGKITGINDGAAKIYVKANDSNNEGEIEKPFLVISVKVIVKHTLSYDGNGNEGGVVPDSVVAKSGGKIKINGNEGSLTKLGYSFAGWNTKPDGSGTDYKEGDELDLAGDITLYAVWKEIGGLPVDYTLRYNGNGNDEGIVPDSVTTSAGIKIRIKGNEGSLTKLEHGFQGWNTKSDGSGIDYREGDELDLTGDVILYAVWEKDSSIPVEYSLIYNGNGNNEGTVPDSVTTGAGIKIRIKGNEGNLKKLEHNFVGWNTKPDGSGTNYKDGDEFNLTEEITLYAVWKRIIENPKEESGGGGVTDKENSKKLEKKEHRFYVTGYPNFTFQPENNITRAEVITIFSNILEDYYTDEKSKVSSFKDLNQSYWYSGRIGFMESLEIIKGYPDGSFRGDEPMTRAEFATVAANFDKLKPTSKNIFSDITENYWAKEFILSSVDKGWVVGYPDGEFKPEKYITRAEVVTIINNMLNRDADKVYVDEYINELKLYKDLTNNYWAYYDIYEASETHKFKKIDNDRENWTSIVKEKVRIS